MSFSQDFQMGCYVAIGHVDVVLCSNRSHIEVRRYHTLFDDDDDDGRRHPLGSSISRR